ncbi:MAG: isoleucine--tRNA ligase [Candidatus Eremiobacteraeota bacterium]|nr:isoleucine--tRNA ligase [Candidatus Eremiobacteraeota bacterium]
MTAVTRDYRSTLNLPKTAFPMKADLTKREPDRVKWWAEHRTYEKRLEKNKGAKPWILHDGPPYANGNLHMGHFLNRFLKDCFVKIHLLDGEWAAFIPGWDMHGLPIELETLKHLGLDYHKTDPIELRAKCKERALHWLDIQRETILRMGCFAGLYDDPYRTIDPSFEKAIVETLADLAEKNLIYKGLRSTLWCIHDETALAEAEIEYDDHVSPSIYVRFTANEQQRADLLQRCHPERSAEGKPLSIIIWTTTPWTLPANLMIALDPEARYGLYDAGDELVIVAEALAKSVAQKLGKPLAGLAGVPGAKLEMAAVRHPFMDRDSIVVVADHVELDTGTGAVHTAPGHGADDFELGVKYGFAPLNPVDAAGRFTGEAGPYAGREIFDANAIIIDDLRASGKLVCFEDYTHSYPHCWRCKNPVIFRATAQWFIGMDRERLRQRILEQIPSVHWIPEWGETRMAQMIELHPEWCLSRQRIWGTPIPAFDCEACNEAIIDVQVARRVAERFGRDGSDVWWTEPLESFLPEGFACPKCGGTRFRKEMNIVDIWFESGVTWRGVLVTRDQPFPADLYLEGGDQYRGWFRSNLITSVAVRDCAPYKGVLSYGWVNDAEGRAMHKSLGNYIGAVDGMETYGADVLRLWAASVEWSSDVRLGPKMLENVGNVYRNLRLRLRYLLSVVDDLPPNRVMPRSAMEPLDRLVLARADALAKQVVEDYRSYRLHDAYLALVAFDNEFSAFYVDAVKDRLYTSARDADRRRSAQSAALEMLRTLCVLLAPVLSFTAEEAWQFLPPILKEQAASVFDLSLPRVDRLDEEALGLWSELRALRAKVASNEGLRDYQLAARVSVPATRYERFAALGDNLREALIVSQVASLERSSNADTELVLEPAQGEKCARCWKYLPLGGDPEHPSLCAPCGAIVRKIDETAA